MKFFHLSDLHIGLKLVGRDLREDQEYILDRILDAAAAQRPDAVVIAGDIYDKAIPSAEAYDIFDGFVSKLHACLPDTEIMMISGNHDSQSRVNVFRSILKTSRIHMIGTPPEREGEHIEKVTLRDEYGPVNFYLLPFVKPSMIRGIVGTDADGNHFSYDESIRRLLALEEIDRNERNVLVSHQFYIPAGTDADQVERMESEIITVGNIDQVRTDVLSPFDYAALGHIHKPMRAGSEFYRYCGTPLAVSFSEAGQEKGILMVEMGAKEDPDFISVREIPLIPLRRIRIISGDAKALLEEGCEDYVRIELTDDAESSIPDLKERLREVFPNLLEIRRKMPGGANYDTPFTPEREPDVFELCRSFIGEIDEEEEKILRDVINTVKGEML